MTEEHSTMALVLTGGGARGAYQAGAIKALHEIHGREVKEIPFKILCGTSAGSLNVAYLASQANRFPAAVRRLTQLWCTLTTDKIYESSFSSLSVIGFRLIAELLSGGFIKTKKSRSLLDTSPLRRLIDRYVPFENIEKNIQSGVLEGIAITAVNYSNGFSRVFYQSKDTTQPWRRFRRFGEPAFIRKEHVLASSAIPILFPPVLIDDHYYGDGSLRNYTPLSAGIKLGAEKLIIIGVRRDEHLQPPTNGRMPTFARVISLILNSVLLDAIDLDYERLNRINHTLTQLRSDGTTPLKPIKSLMIRPSCNIGEIAEEESGAMPKTVSHLIKGLGTKKEAADLISYLLFEPSFTTRLVKLGYDDTMNRRAEIESFLAS